MLQVTNIFFITRIFFVKKKKKTFENLEITDINSEGFGVAKTNEKVVFVKNTIPGEIVDVRIYKKKRRYLYGQVEDYKKLSPDRISPECTHFGECGGCKLQFLAYEKQLFYKEKIVLENIKRIGKIMPENIFPVMASPKDFEYRNKLEFTFSNNRWITQNEVDGGKEIIQKDALGFHVAGRFDKV
ncbi:MAG: 23S rRNA (uracil-5-)-methyltransferase RumA, partial [Candidatus Zixiibacteriota bacterium]